MDVFCSSYPTKISQKVLQVKVGGVGRERECVCVREREGGEREGKREGEIKSMSLHLLKNAISTSIRPHVI